MTRAAAAPALVVGAALAAVAGASSAAHAALLLAIPFAAVAVLDAVSAVVAGHGGRVGVALRVLSLALLLAAVLADMPGIALVGVVALAARPLEGSPHRTRRVGRRTLTAPR